MTDDGLHFDEPTTLSDRLDGIATRWSLVQLAHQSGSQDAVAARNALVLRYSAAVRRYLAAFAGDDADDLAQDVMVQLLVGGFTGANQERGRFRDYLKTTIRNHVRSLWSKSSRRKPADVDVQNLMADDNGLDVQWLAAWQKSILDHAFDALEKFEQERENTFAATVVRLRLEHSEASSEELAGLFTASTGKPIRADALRQLLRRARLKFAECIVDEIASSLPNPTPSAITDELAAVGLLDHVKVFLPDDWTTRGVLRGGEE